MVFGELENRYGPYLAEMVRQVLTLDEFGSIDVEDVLPCLEERAERLFQAFRKSTSMEAGSDALTRPALVVLERRWQEAEDLVQKVTRAETQAREGDYLAAVGA
jgi:hypothetical protein